MVNLTLTFDNSYAKLPERFFSVETPAPASCPSLIAWNSELAADLDITAPDDTAQIAEYFSGNEQIAGSTPIAQAYCGHQFGHFNPQLGDGRAILLGEVIGKNGARFDLQLKGSGRTKWSRQGDGRAWLGPVLREYLVSEAMHKLGIPTTRALAAVATGDTVYRETPLPGAVLTRVASSHLRVGTFQYFAARGDRDGLQQLFDYARARHYPQATDPIDFLKSVIAKQSQLIANWLSIGFIHGVMNTDNCHIDGITIDYGPCAFMDTYHPQTVYSSIDQYGRYSYDNQAAVIVWNMGQLASALLPLLPDHQDTIDHLTKIVHAMPDQIAHDRRQIFARKLGIIDATPADDGLIQSWLDILQAHQLDFTNSFRALMNDGAQETLPDSPEFSEWYETWLARRDADYASIMAQCNPVIIPRNHQIEAAIVVAVAGDMTPFHTLLQAVQTPYDLTDKTLAFTAPPKPEQVVQATFCGT